MVVPEQMVSTRDPALRRLALVLRRTAPFILLFTVFVMAAAYFYTSTRATAFRSTAVIELTDDVAVGISSTGQRRGDARVAIEAQRRVLESPAFVAELSELVGVTSDDNLSVSTVNPEETPVLEIGVSASTAAVAEVAAGAAVDLYIHGRVQAEVDRLEGELGPLRQQRIEQQELVDSIVAELDLARAGGTASQDEISVLENQTASALRRLQDYDVAIQEREFFQQTVEGRVQLVSPATAASKAGTSPITRAVQFGLIALLLATGAVVLTSQLRGRLLLLDEVRVAIGPQVPILATVPRFRRSFRKGSAALVVGSDVAAREAESFRYARSAIEVATEGKSPMSVVLTSSRANEGKTVTSSNLAMASALGGRSTALLDGDLLNSSVGGLFPTMGRRNAFRDLLSGAISPRQVAWVKAGTPGAELDVLLAPHMGEAPTRTELSVESVSSLFTTLKDDWDVVVVDAPPVLAVSDSMILARAADVTVLIVRIGVTSRRDVETAVTQLRQSGVNLVGVIVTQTTERSESYYGHDYYYSPSAR